MKLAPVERALRLDGAVQMRVVHTGQHYDPAMNGVFFEELGIPAPEVHLGVGSGTHGVQTARILERYEAVILNDRPAATVVFGDVNSTVACALAAVKVGIPIVHVEAGLRSFDRSMPEEVNRLLTDAIADLLLVSDPAGMRNLAAEGVSPEKVRLVGNVMIDTLLRQLEGARALDKPGRLGLKPGGYGLITLHRPSNVDDPGTLERLLGLFHGLAARLPLVFPVHPRTRAAAESAGLGRLLGTTGRFLTTPPLSYKENLGLLAGARMVLTDSGGVQEESSVLGIPCLTMRANTERPVTVERGTSRLVGNDPAGITRAFDDALCGRWPAGGEIPLWDGRAGERVATAIRELIGL